MFAVPTEPASRRKRRRVLSDSSPIDQKKPDTSILCQEPSAKRSAIRAENVVIANNLNFKICFKSLETQHQILIKKCNQNRMISRHSYPVHSFTIPITGRWEWYILAKIDPSVAVVLSCERSNLTDEEHTAIAEEIMRRITVEPVCKLTKLWATRYAEIKNIYMVSRNITQFKPIPVVNIQEMAQNDRRPEIYNECIKSKVDGSINKNSMDTLKNVKVEMKVDEKTQTGCFKTKKIIPTAELINQLLSTNNVEGSSGTSDLINNLPSQKTYLLKLGPYSPNVLEGILRIDVSLIILRRFILHSIRTISSDVLTSFIPLGWPVPFPSIVNISFFEAMRNLLLSHRMFYTKIYKIISDQDLITGFIEKNRKLVEVLRSMIPELEILRDNIVCNDLLECFINTINYYIRKEEHERYLVRHRGKGIKNVDGKKWKQRNRQNRTFQLFEVIRRWLVSRPRQKMPHLEKLWQANAVKYFSSLSDREPFCRIHIKTFLWMQEHALAMLLNEEDRNTAKKLLDNEQMWVKIFRDVRNEFKHACVLMLLKEEAAKNNYYPINLRKAFTLALDKYDLEERRVYCRL